MIYIIYICIGNNAKHQKTQIMTLSVLSLENYLAEIKNIALTLKTENKKTTRGSVREILQNNNPKLTKSEANALINEFVKSRK